MPTQMTARTFNEFASTRSLSIRACVSSTAPGVHCRTAADVPPNVGSASGQPSRPPTTKQKNRVSEGRTVCASLVCCRRSGRVVARLRAFLIIARAC